MHLNTQSTLDVDINESQRTLTLLRGEAMFEVAKDPERPFRVAAGDVVFEAIGTVQSLQLPAACYRGVCHAADYGDLRCARPAIFYCLLGTGSGVTGCAGGRHCQGADGGLGNQSVFSQRIG